MVYTNENQQGQLSEDTNTGIVLRVINLKKYFPVQAGIFKRVSGYVYAVNDVSFDVRKGETIGIVGESGCGKTTLGRTILGLIPTTDGQIIYNGMDISNYNDLEEDRTWRRRTKQIYTLVLLIGLLLFIIGLLNTATYYYTFANLERLLELDILILLSMPGALFGLFFMYKGATTVSKLAPQQLSLRKKIQIVFQDPHASLNPRMTVRTTLSEPLSVHKIMPNDEVEDYLISLLEEVGLGVMHLDRFPHEFSGGQRQRIVIARALVLQPDIIILDEPTASTDVSVQAKTLNLLKDLQKTKQLTFLFISHDLSVIKHMSNRIIVMYLGKAVEIGNRDMFSTPEKIHPYTEALFAAVPVADPTFKKKKIILGGDVPSPSNPPPGCVFHTRCTFAQNNGDLMEICNTQEPILKEVEVDHLITEEDHLIACHLYTKEFAHFKK
ncbi:MAG: ABC transporter ATP-binding protein [Candidatus Hodarchaeales archaeon]|jgi:peptide/nickel transport system ATP-binding protein